MALEKLSPACSDKCTAWTTRGQHWAASQAREFQGTGLTMDSSSPLMQIFWHDTGFGFQGCRCWRVLQDILCSSPLSFSTRLSSTHLRCSYYRLLFWNPIYGGKNQLLKEFSFDAIFLSLSSLLFPPAFLVWSFHQHLAEPAIVQGQGIHSHTDSSIFLSEHEVTTMTQLWLRCQLIKVCEERVRWVVSVDGYRVSRPWRNGK